MLLDQVEQTNFQVEHEWIDAGAESMSALLTMLREVTCAGEVVV